MKQVMRMNQEVSTHSGRCNDRSRFPEADIP